MMRKLKTWYTAAAVTLLTTLLVLILINVVFSAAIVVKHRLRPDPGPIWKYGWKPVLAAYPGWNRKEIVEILNEIYFDHSIEYEPFTQFRERPRQQKYVAVDAAGFRNVKRQGAWPPDAAYTNIFVFGGSTTFGYGVANDETIPSYLQEAALTNRGKPVRVYNFGRGFYFSSQETALLYHLLASNIVPDIAVFIDGLNDFINLDGNPEYTGDLKSFMDGKQSPDWLTKSPINRAANFVRQRLLNSSEPAEVRESFAVNDSTLQAVVKRWQRNKKATEAMAASFGVHPIFVWQPSPTYKYDLKYHVFCDGDFRRFGEHGRSRKGYTLVDQLQREQAMGDHFLWLGDMQEHITENLYVDLLHYKPAFSRTIAGRIYEFIQQQGLLAGASNEMAEIKNN